MSRRDLHGEITALWVLAMVLVVALMALWITGCSTTRTIPAGCETNPVYTNNTAYAFMWGTLVATKTGVFVAMTQCPDIYAMAHTAAQTAIALLKGDAPVTIEDLGAATAGANLFSYAVSSYFPSGVPLDACYKQILISWLTQI